MKRADVTREQLQAIVDYDPETGVMAWKDPDRSGRPRKGSASRYECIRINRKAYYVHRLVFLLMTGQMPEGEVDHINGDKKDNRWCNLRDVSRKQNMQNMKTTEKNVSGVMGVNWHTVARKWMASITSSRETLYLGIFADWFDAVCARKSAEAHHGFHKNHGRRA